MGAGALTRLAFESPGRFERLVFYLPARTQAHLAAMADAINDLPRLTELVGAELPVAVRQGPEARRYVTEPCGQIGPGCVR